jgi:hypothetical protein
MAVEVVKEFWPGMDDVDMLSGWPVIPAACIAAVNGPACVDWPCQLANDSELGELKLIWLRSALVN